MPETNIQVSTLADSHIIFSWFGFGLEPGPLTFCKHSPIKSILARSLPTRLWILQYYSNSLRQMLCTTFCLGMVADAAAAHRHELSPSDPKYNHDLPGSRGSMSSVNSSPFQDPQARTKTLRSPAIRSAATLNSTNLTALEVPLSQLDDHDPSWSASPRTGRGPQAKGGKRSTVVSKTSFQLAHPPPTIKHRQRFNIRPKMLLQLQQISDATRPIPAFDVLPSVVFAPRFARKFPSIFKCKNGLGADDLVIVNSQNYDMSDHADSISDEESWEAREIVAAICQPKKKTSGAEDLTEICLKHGAVWEASPLPSGAYEIVSTDEKGSKLTVRWVPRPPILRRRTYNGQDSSNLPLADQRRFTFSIINPDSRRHPVIATLSRSSIDISDKYSVPSAVSRAQSSTSSQDDVLLAPASPHMRLPETESLKPGIIETDERLRSLIIITGIWVAFREGFSSNFQYDKPVGSTAQGTTSSPSPKTRSLSGNITNLGKGRNSAAESPKLDDIHRIKPTSENCPPTSPAASSPLISHSTGAAFLQRAHIRRPDSSKKSLPLAASLERIPSAQKEPKSSFGTCTSARNLGPFKPVASRNDAPWNQSPDLVAIAPTGPVARKPTKLNKLFGFIKRTSGAH